MQFKVKINDCLFDIYFKGLIDVTLQFGLVVNQIDCVLIF